MFRFARAVEVTFAWWDKVPVTLRRLALVVVLRHVGLLPSTTDLVSLIGQ